MDLSVEGPYVHETVYAPLEFSNSVQTGSGIVISHGIMRPDYESDLTSSTAVVNADIFVVFSIFIETQQLLS
jgi:hypothetical protein